MERFDDSIADSLLTPDEWRVKGLTVACQCSGSDRSLDLLQKALCCFEHAADTALSERARTHIRAMQTYNELQIGESDIQAAVKLAGTMCSCLHSDMLDEAFMLARAWSHTRHVDSSEQFKLFVEHVFDPMVLLHETL